jgi:pimeloyl-ACP methyl ester carboxylesterase
MSPSRLAVGLVALMCLAGGQSASAAPGKISWSKCFGGPFQCASVQVPLDYDQPNGPSISIALARLPATDPAHRIGSLFLNPGGPGGSGVDYVHFAGPSLYTGEVRARFDLVGFDPRGIARSTALRCFGTQKQFSFPPIAFPTTAAEEQQWEANDSRLADACAARGSKVIDHMSTANVARDMDRLRALAGDAQLTYAGVSYGSYLGVTYANMFPSQVRALVVDGILDPIAWSTGSGDAATVPFSSRLDSAAGAQKTLDEFFRLCDLGGPNCAFSGDSAARFAALADKLKANPQLVTFPDGSQTVLDYSNLIGVTLGAMYDSSVWGDFAAFLAAVESEAAASVLGADYARFRARPAYSPRRGDIRHYNDAEGFPAVACEDSDNPSSYDAWHTVGLLQDQYSYFGRLWTWASSICAVWTTRDGDRFMGPFTHQTANPLLIVGNLVDPATRYENAVKVAGLMPGSRLLTMDGWGHTSLFASACIDEAITRYLVDQALPPQGTICPQDHAPFS